MAGVVVFLVVVSLAFSAGLFFARCRFWRGMCGDLSSRLDFLEGRVTALGSSVSQLVGGMDGV